MQLLTVISPQLEQLKKEGEIGRKKINQYARYGTVFLATVQGYGLAVGLESSADLVINPGMFFKVSTVTTIVAGTIFLMWLGEQITQRGIGNGISLIIFSNTDSSILSKVLSFKIISLVGLSSYSIYLLHQPLFALFRIYKNKV